MTKKYLTTYFRLISMAFSSYATNRIDSVTYLLGKIVRFVFFLILLASLFRFTDQLAGYSGYEVFLFFLTFNLVDVISQVVWRGIYVFPTAVRRGHFDFYLTKPIHPLLLILCRLTDLLDIIFLIPIVVLLVLTIVKLSIVPTITGLLLYLLFLIFSLLIILGIHVLTAAITIRAVDSSHVIWLYRDLMTVGRFPPEIFSSTLQFIFTFILPIIIIVSFPTKILLTRLDPFWIPVTAAITAVFMVISLSIWRQSLRHYTSASS